MIRRMVLPLVPLVTLVALGLGALPARAQLVDEEGVGRLTVGGLLGVQVTSMSDVNDNLNVVNQFLGRDLIRNLDPIHAALATGLDVRYKLGQTPPEEPGEPVSFMQRLSVGFTWGAINAVSQFNVTRAQARFYTRSTTYYPYVLYHFPFLDDVEPRVSIYGGGGPVFLRAGYAEWKMHDDTINNFLPEGDIAELTGEAKAEGTGTGFALQAGASFQLSKRFSVALDTGYRLAKLSNIKLVEAVGDTERFTGTGIPGQPDVTREPGDWGVIDFFLRDEGGVFQGRNRRDPKDEGGCADCPLYYTGGPLKVDYSGPFATFSFRVHF